MTPSRITAALSLCVALSCSSAAAAESAPATGGTLKVADPTVYAGDTVKFTGSLPGRGAYDDYVVQVRRGSTWKKLTTGYTKGRGRLVEKVELEVENWSAGRYVFRVLGKAGRFDDFETTVTRPVKVKVSDRPGSQAKPWGPGQAFSTEDWTWSLGATDFDALPERLAHYPDATVPVSGWSYISVPVSFTRTGSGSGNAWAETSLSFLGSDGVVYTSFGEAAGIEMYCSLADDWSDAPELYPGASAAGTKCLPVRTAAIAGGLWRLSADYDNEQFVRGQ